MKSAIVNSRQDELIQTIISLKGVNLFWKLGSRGS